MIGHATITVEHFGVDVQTFVVVGADLKIILVIQTTMDEDIGLSLGILLFLGLFGICVLWASWKESRHMEGYQPLANTV